jgi:hypothetical protein
MPAPDKPPELRTGIKFEPRRTKDQRIVLRPVASAVTFLSSDGIVLTLHLPDIDLAQIGAIFVFPVQPNLRTAGDPLSSLPPRMAQLLTQSATPLFLFTEYVAYVTATDLPEHEGPAPEVDLVAEQQAHIAMQTMANQSKPNAGDNYAAGGPHQNGRVNADQHNIISQFSQQQRQAAQYQAAHQFPCAVAPREHP